MSVETDFRAALLARAGLVALVGSRVAQDALPEGSTYPAVVYSVAHDYQLGLGNTVLGDQASVVAQCWGTSGAQAAAVAAEVMAALAVAPSESCATVLGYSTAFDEELGLDSVVLNVEWWV